MDIIYNIFIRKCMHLSSRTQVCSETETHHHNFESSFFEVKAVLLTLVCFKTIVRYISYTNYTWTRGKKRHCLNLKKKVMWCYGHVLKYLLKSLVHS